jgi:hypothetical protein
MSESSRRGQLFSVQQTRDTNAFAMASLRITIGIFFTISGSTKSSARNSFEMVFGSILRDLSEPERTLSCFRC